MTKLTPLKERKRLWAKKISATTLRLVRIHNQFQKFCHHPKCRGAMSDCPQRKYDHAKCEARLSIHTALLWDFKSYLSDVISYLHEARYDLKNGSLQRASYSLGIAEESLRPLEKLLNFLNRAGGYHTDHPDPDIRAWSQLVTRYRHDYLILNAIDQFISIRKSIRIVAKKAKVRGWESLQEDRCE